MRGSVKHFVKNKKLFVNATLTAGPSAGPTPSPSKICGHCGQPTASSSQAWLRACSCTRIQHCINSSLWTMWTISFCMVHNVHNAPGQNAPGQVVDNVDHLDKQLNSLYPICLFFKQLFFVNCNSHSPQYPQSPKTRIPIGRARGPYPRFSIVRKPSTTSTNRKL